MSSRSNLPILATIVIALLVIAGLSIYTHSIISSMSQQNSSLSQEVKTLNQEVSVLNMLEFTLEHKEVQAATNYLASNYNPSVGLIPETPHSNVFWLYSDNYLAALALRQAGRSNSTLMAIADNISTTLARYSRDIGDAMNQYMVLGGDWNAPCSFNSTSNYTVSHVGNSEIMATLNNGTGKLSESQYADITFLEAICYIKQGNSDGWSQGFNDGTSVFNGIGFNDTPFQTGSSKGVYQTYKPALYIYAVESQCGEPINQTTDQTAFATLLEMQAPNGGFYTGYNGSLSSGVTETNTETTSLAILALSTFTVCFP